MCAYLNPYTDLRAERIGSIWLGEILTPLGSGRMVRRDALCRSTQVVDRNSTGFLLLVLNPYTDLRRAISLAPVGRRVLRRRSSGPSVSAERESISFGWDPATFPPALLAPGHCRSGWFSTARARTPTEVPAFSPYLKAAARGTPRRRPNAQAGDFRLPFCRRVEMLARCFVEHADRRRLLVKTVALATRTLPAAADPREAPAAMLGHASMRRLQRQMDPLSATTEGKPERRHVIAGVGL
jgi:hypothetical protein